MSDRLVLALPSKGRLREQCANLLARAGLVVSKSGSGRGYQGDIAQLPGVEVNFVSSAEIAQLLKSGKAHLGITGEDLLREPEAAGAERRAYRDLAPPGGGAREQQVGNVRARDQQHEGDRAKQHEQRLTGVADNDRFVRGDIDAVIVRMLLR